MTASSEDDKKYPLDNDLTLDLNNPSTNDAPSQNSAVASRPTKAQDKESDEIVAEDEGETPVQKALEHFEDPRKLASEVGEEIDTEMPEVLSDARDRLEDLVVQAKEDPMSVAKEAGKAILMVAGACAILKAIFHRR